MIHVVVNIIIVFYLILRMIQMSRTLKSRWSSTLCPTGPPTPTPALLPTWSVTLEELTTHWPLAGSNFTKELATLRVRLQVSVGQYKPTSYCLKFLLPVLVGDACTSHVRVMFSVNRVVLSPRGTLMVVLSGRTWRRGPVGPSDPW